MPLDPTWPDLLLRLALATVAGAAIGWNRGAHGRPAGLRTHLLVCLAAAIAMVLANLLLDTRGKTTDSFVQMDVMRLPLGILSGIGFIGGGAILKQGTTVQGTATAASLWATGAIGVSVGLGSYDVAVTVAVFTFLTLRLLTLVKEGTDITKDEVAHKAD
jgi:putative Mg2+ transporter-C (MgtC) family protein